MCASASEQVKSLTLSRKSDRFLGVGETSISSLIARHSSEETMCKLRLPTAVLVTVLLISIGCEKDDNSTESQLRGKIIGRISDARSNAPIVNATISTNPSTFIAASDSVGQYVISKIAYGRYTVTASKSGYTPGSVDVTVRSDTLSVADIKLSN